MKVVGFVWMAAICLQVGMLSAHAEQSVAPQAKYAVEPRFQLLRFGEVRPAGWIKEQMQRDLTCGFAGHMPEIAVKTCGQNIFTTGRNTPQKGSKAGGTSGGSTWWNGETEGNWRSGFTMMTLLAGTPEQRAKLDAMIVDLLKYQDKDGYMGIYAPELRWKTSENKWDGGWGELWPQACLFRGLLCYYEATGKKEILTAVELAVQLSIRSFAGRGLPPGQHTLMFCDVCERLYDLTGNVVYRDFGLRLCHEMSQRGMGASDDIQFKFLLNEKRPFYFHAATTCETIRLPVWSAGILGDPTWTKARDLAFAKAFRQVSSTGGPVAQEAFDGIVFNPDHTAYECCTLKEWMCTCLSAAQKTGLAKFADQAENTFLNAAQGSRLSNGKAVSYCTYDNEYSRKGGVHSSVHPSFNRNDRCKLSPCHEDIANCCAPNFTQIGPNFVRNMWMRTGDGLAAMLYGPCEVKTAINGVSVEIAEQTGYPFENGLAVSVRPEKPAQFTLRFRIPSWCDKADIVCDGASITQADGWASVAKTWLSGDKATISFAAKVQLIPADNKEFYLRCGPLFYALAIPADLKPIKNYPVPGFHDYHASPSADATWNYAFAKDVSPSNPPSFTVISEKLSDARYPWDVAALKLKGRLIDQDAHQAKDVNLVPMGCGDAVLRRCTFTIAQ